MKGRCFSMKNNYTIDDFKRGKLKNISDQTSTDDKILYTIKAYLAAGKIANKEKLRKEVDLVLA